ncbi:MAG TPA: polyprenyl synthetase family protein [Gemmatimonadales bacterium]|nr:polyprenyl synthetase family protein [Gemmatimonadales bacterium]
MSHQTAGVTLAEVQQPVIGQLDQVTATLRDIVAADFPLIQEVNGHLLQMKGKLFRPTLLLLSHQASGGHDPRAVRLAAVIELIHLATLVHDDSVDHSALRRGMPTVNALFSHQVSVIMGDYLYSRAIIELVGLGDLEPLRVLSRVTNEMTIGEMRQLAQYDALAFREEDYEVTIRAKTASLLAGACETGALLAGADAREALRTYGDALGMAFQVCDDLLDYTEAESVTGKPSGNDLREHKVTLPLIAALREMNPSERDKVAQLFSEAEPADEQVLEVIALVERCGGLEFARNRALEWAEQAEHSLQGLPPSPARDALHAAIAYAVERRS